MTQAEQPSHKEFSFASFRLLRDKRLLLKGEEPVRLGGRALEILAALVERPGTVVTKEELFARVWPKQFVEEGNLKFHVAGLRKALGDGQETAPDSSPIFPDGDIASSPQFSLPSRSSPRLKQTFQNLSCANYPLRSIALWGAPVRS